jgi:hypothetical protein
MYRNDSFMSRFFRIRLNGNPAKGPSQKPVAMSHQDLVVANIDSY